MIQLRNPFAIRNGRIILIEDLTANERGMNCQCRCPACNGEFIARMGEINVHHFAHSKDACDEVIAYSSGLYKLIQQVLSDGTPFYIPELSVKFQIQHRLLDEYSIEEFCSIARKKDNKKNIRTVSKGRSISFEHIELSYDSKNHIQAIELMCKGRKMAIKVMPPDTVCKNASVSAHKKMATLVLDFTEDADIIQKSSSENFHKYLFSKNLRKYWIYNPMIKKIYPELLDINNKAYYEYIERQKQLEAERKAIREEQEKLEQARKAIALEKEKRREEERKIIEKIREEERKITEKRREEERKIIEKRRDEERKIIKKRREEERKIIEQKKVSDAKAKEILAYESVKNKFVQQTEQIKDCYGIRWVMCEICGEIKKESEFWIYGGYNRINIGQCYGCNAAVPNSINSSNV